jgi:hypothetical protein
VDRLDNEDIGIIWARHYLSALKAELSKPKLLQGGGRLISKFQSSLIDWLPSTDSFLSAFSDKSFYEDLTVEPVPQWFRSPEDWHLRG